MSKPDKENIDKHKARLLAELSRHIGAHNAIGMGELYCRVFDKVWMHKINDTRHLRTVVTLLRNEGVPICSASDKNTGGYYLASAGSELENYCSRIRRRGITALMMEAKIRKTALPELLGQIQLSLGKGSC